MFVVPPARPPSPQLQRANPNPGASTRYDHTYNGLTPSLYNRHGSNDPEAMKCVAEDSSITAGDCTDLSLLGMGMTQCCPTYVA